LILLRCVETEKAQRQITNGLLSAFALFLFMDNKTTPGAVLFLSLNEEMRRSKNNRRISLLIMHFRLCAEGYRTA